MKLRSHLIPMFVASLLLASAPALARGKSSWASRRAEFLATIKVGQWIRLAGDVQGDRTVSCNELKLLAGDFVDDDCELVGVVGRVDRSRREFTIATVPVHPIRNAEFESPENTIQGLADLHPGMIIEVSGSYTPEGFLAHEVDDESEELRSTTKASRVKLTGRIERVDLDRGRIYVMGLPFVVSEETQVKSVLR